MFSLANVKARTYEFEHPDTGRPLHIKPPKLAVLQRFTTAFDNPQMTPAEAAEVLAEVIGHNAEGCKVTTEMVAEWMDTDQMVAFVSDFLGWLNKEKASDPN